MAGDVDRNRSLKEALYDCLTAILSPLQETRISAEEQIKVLEVTEEFGVHLVEFTVDPTGSLAIRQLSSVLLKQYVEAHWSDQSDKFRPPETSDAAKAAIRQILLSGLRETISKVRTSIAYAVSAIAHWDWPEAWPELFGILMNALTSGDPNALHGAMRVLTEFTQDVTDVQMSRVAPVILPEMYKIFMQAETYSIRTRSRAVNIFNTCAAMIATILDSNKSVVKQLLYPVLPQFTQAFIEALQVPDGETSDSGLKMEVLQAITVLVKSFPKTMSQWLQQILPPVWNLFTQSVDFYVRTVVNNTEEANNPVDSDGEVLGFENLVYSVFEFVLGLIDTSRFRSTVKKSSEQILYYMILYMQITDDQERMWSNDPDQFVEDEDDDTFSYSVRISAQDLLLSLASEFQKESAPALCQAIAQHLQEASVAKNAGNQYWWKVHESCMLAMGSVRMLVIDQIQTGKMQFDLSDFLESVVLADMNLAVSPFLVGRCLWTGSRFASVMSPKTMERFLHATMGGLHPSQPPSVRISAVRAVFGFCEHLKNTGNVQIMYNFLPTSVDGLLAISTQFSSSVLALTLETLSLVLSIDSNFTAGCESKVTPLTVAVFLKYSSDPLIVSLVQDMIKVLAENEQCMQPLQQRLLPTLVSILQANAEKVPPGLPAVALDVLQTVVRGSKTLVSDALVHNAFPAAVHCTLNTDDNATMQSGGECLRAFASVGLDKLVQWHDEHGKNGLYYIIQVISKLLDPKTPEYTASFVGKLISVVLEKVGSQLGENLDLMLRSVLSKMQRSESLSVIQSLVMIFANLMHTQMEAVLDFLSNVPGPTGKSALEFVLTEWCSRQHLFYGGFEGKVSIVALCKLLHFAVNHNDSRFHNIEVTGDQIIQSDQGVRTRSKTAQVPIQWTKVPVLVKIYKLLINELSNQMESNMVSQEAEELEDEDESCVEDDDDEDEGSGQTLSSLLDQYKTADLQSFTFDGEIDEEDDPDALQNPIYQIELQTYLTEFLQSLSQQPYYGMFSAHHSTAEKQVLQAIGITA